MLDHSNLSISLALLGAAWGVPFLPTRSLLGADLLDTNASLKVQPSPFGGEPLVLVPALRPDVAFLQVQRAEPNGLAHCWGNLGVSEAAALAARSVILVAEEIVSPDLIQSDPNRVLVPAPRVAAVIHEPGGAHPSPVQGHYRRDHAMYHDYHESSRSVDGFKAWLDDWVLGVDDRRQYLERLGPERWRSLKHNRPRLAAPVDYGY